VFATLTYIVNGLLCGIVLGIAFFLRYAGSPQAWAGFFPFVGGLVMVSFGLLCTNYEHLIFKPVFKIFAIFDFFIAFLFFLFVVEWQVVMHGAEFGVYASHVFGQSSFIELMVNAFSWLFIKSVRRSIERRAQLSIHDEREQYNREWNRLLDDASSQEALQKLADLCRRHGFDKMPAPRHTVPAMGRPNPHGGLDTSSSLSSATQSVERDLESLAATFPAQGALAGATRVACLDQLYLQAHLIWPMMCALTHSWAASGGGFLHIDHASTLESITGRNRAVGEACAGRSLPRWRVGQVANASSAQDGQQGGSALRAAAARPAGVNPQRCDARASHT